MPSCEDCIHNKVCAEVNSLKCRKDFIWYDAKSGCPYFATDVVPKSEEGAQCPTCYGTGRIGTTNWLTKNISKKQLAEEKEKAIAEHEQHIKAEVAREIFKEIEKILADDRIDRKLTELGMRFVQSGEPTFEERFAKLKKKYTEGEDG